MKILKFLGIQPTHDLYQPLLKKSNQKSPWSKTVVNRSVIIEARGKQLSIVADRGKPR